MNSCGFGMAGGGLDHTLFLVNRSQVATVDAAAAAVVSKHCLPIF
jgi:hypothetical protein